MRLTIIVDDGVVGIGGVFRAIDVSALAAQEIRAVQWDDPDGHIELVDGTNIPLTDISPFQQYIDAWNALTPPPPPTPTSAELKAAALARINTAYEIAVRQITAGYPQHEIDSWPKQEEEARAWQANNSTPTPWLDAAALARGITKAALVIKILYKAQLFAVIHGQLTGKRQKLEDQIDALGDNPTQQQLDAIQW